MIQQGVSVGGDADPSSGSMSEAVGNEMTIGKVMDWIEARLEAIKSREEEEDEEEEKERVKSGTMSMSKPSGAAKSRPPESVSSAARHKEQVCFRIFFFPPDCYADPSVIVVARNTSGNPSDSTCGSPTYFSDLCTSLSFHTISSFTHYTANASHPIR